MSCNLISKNQKIFRIFVNNDSHREKDKFYPEIDNFFNEFSKFEIENNKLNNSLNNEILKKNSNSNLINSNNNEKKKNSFQDQSLKIKNINNESGLNFFQNLNSNSKINNLKINSNSNIIYNIEGSKKKETTHQ